MRKIFIGLLMLLPLTVSAETAAQLFDRAKKEADLHTQIELLTQVIEKSPRHVGQMPIRLWETRAGRYWITTGWLLCVPGIRFAIMHAVLPMRTWQSMDWRLWILPKQFR